MTWLGLINPNAGGSRMVSTYQKALENKDVVWKTPMSVEEMKTLLTTAFERGQRDFIVMGGDGTVFQTLNVLFPKAFDAKVTLAIFPTGTGNSMLRDFTHDPQQLIEAFGQRRTKPCDLCILETQENTYYFSNLISFGFVADVGKHRNKYFSRMGTLGYVGSVFSTLPGLSSVTLANDITKAQNACFVSINNTRYTGGAMMMAPMAKPDDGKLSVVWVHPLSRWDVLTTFPKIFSGDHVHHPKVDTFDLEKIQFQEAIQQPIMIDGDMIEATPLAVRVHQHAFEVIA